MESDEPASGILVVYALLAYPLRSSLEDHLYSFERHSSQPCTYLNLMVRRVPARVLARRWRLVVFHKSVFDQRWVPRDWARVRRRVRPLRELDAPRVALPQDDFFRADDIESFVRDERVDCVCTVAPPAQWDVIYTGIDRSKVRLAQVLTGYLEDATVERIRRIVDEAPGRRPIDIGYRAWHAEPWLGRHGQQKTAIADQVSQLGPPRGLTLDVSTSESKTFYGDDWFRFLANCRYTIGVEGGSSVLDRDGSICDRTRRYTSLHPKASFEEIEAACFADADGSVQEYAVSPRHLEACATKTCQILVEGDYNGVLRAGEHYIAVRSDMSNAAEVLETLGDESRRERIVEAAYRDVVASGRFTYERYVEDVEQTVLGERAAIQPALDPEDARMFAADRRRDQRSRIRAWVEYRLLRILLVTLGPGVRWVRTRRAQLKRE